MLVTFINMHVWFRISASPVLASAHFPSLALLLKSFLFFDHEHKHLQKSSTSSHHQLDDTGRSATLDQMTTETAMTPLSPSSVGYQFSQQLDIIVDEEQQEQETIFSQSFGHSSHTLKSPTKRRSSEHSHHESSFRAHPRGSLRRSRAGSNSSKRRRSKSRRPMLSQDFWQRYLQMIEQWNMGISETSSQASDSCLSTESFVSSVSTVQWHNPQGIQSTWLHLSLTLDKVCMYIFAFCSVISPTVIFIVVPYTYNEYLKRFDEDAHNQTDFFYNINDIQIHYFHEHSKESLNVRF